MSYFLHIIILSTALWLIGRKQPDQIVFYASAALKLMAGVAVGLIYRVHYYGGDTWAYYDAARLLGDLPLNEWWSQLGKEEIGAFENQPRAIFFTKIVSGFIFVTRGDYWVVSSYLSFISFLSNWFFYRQTRSTLPNIKWPVIIGFLLFPSSVFWSAGILKGVITNASVIFVSAFSIKLFYRKKIHILEIIMAGLAIILLFYIKYYLLIVLFPVVVYALFDHRAHRFGLTKPLRGSVYVAILLTTLLIAPKINPNLRIMNLPQVIHTNQLQIQKANASSSHIDLLIEPNWSSLLLTAPKALVFGLFGPSIFDAGSIWSWVPRLENLVLFILALFSFGLLFRKKLWDPDILVIAALMFIVILAILLPLAAPNFGTLVRYRAPFTPFLVTLVTILPSWILQRRKE
ncbi:MAG: hypothetical protein GY816_18485 [Cytophagales bacterium]|nr:hypothetical protein [Cytophagales bacterium]